MVIENNTYPLINVLEIIGFVQTVEGHSYDFGSCLLTAKPYFEYSIEMILFSAVHLTERTISDLTFKLPVYVESFEQGVALITYYLHKHPFENYPEWLYKGKEWEDHLPWRKDSKEYENTPKAIIEHEWFRVFLKKLKTHVETIDEEQAITFSFNGTVLKAEGNTFAEICPGKGNPWNNVASLSAKQLKHLQKKVPHLNAWVYIWGNALHIGTRCLALDENESLTSIDSV